MGLSIEVPLAEAFAAHSRTTVANIDGEGCLKGRVSADRSDDYLGDCVMRNPVETVSSCTGQAMAKNRDTPNRLKR